MSNKSVMNFASVKGGRDHLACAAYRDVKKAAEIGKFLADTGRAPEVEERQNMGFITPYDVVCFDRQEARVARVKVTVRRRFKVTQQ